MGSQGRLGQGIRLVPTSRIRGRACVVVARGRGSRRWHQLGWTESDERVWGRSGTLLESAAERMESEEAKLTASGVWSGMSTVYYNESREPPIVRGGYASGERATGAGHPAERDASTSS
jgi:hypothetical protein